MLPLVTSRNFNSQSTRFVSNSSASPEDFCCYFENLCMTWYASPQALLFMQLHLITHIFGEGVLIEKETSGIILSAENTE